MATTTKTWLSAPLAEDNKRRAWLRIDQITAISDVLNTSATTPKAQVSLFSGSSFQVHATAAAIMALIDAAANVTTI